MHRFQKELAGGEYKFLLMAKMIPATLAFVRKKQKFLNDICHLLILENTFL